MLVSCKLSRKIRGNHGETIAGIESDFPGLKIASAIIETPNEEFEILVLNLSKRLVRVPVNSTLGRMRVLDLVKEVLIVTEWEENERNEATINEQDLERNLEFPDNVLSEADLSTEQRTVCVELLNEFSDVFGEGKQGVGETSIYHHKIETDGGPIVSTPYPTSPWQRREISRHIDNLLKQKKN
jgi:hypothetical protein